MSQVVDVGIPLLQFLCFQGFLFLLDEHHDSFLLSLKDNKTNPIVDMDNFL